MTPWQWTLICRFMLIMLESVMEKHHPVEFYTAASELTNQIGKEIATPTYDDKGRRR